MRKNSTPTNYHEAEDRCPSCGEPVNVDLDLDERDYCNLCRWQRRVVPDPVPDEWKTEDYIFVFGSNKAGRHGAGAALTAFQKWGAKMGVGIGIAGRSYAIPTKDYDVRRVLSVREIKTYVDKFMYFASNTEETFLVTKVGCGLAGHKIEDIAPLFYAAAEFDNVWLPSEFWDIINKMDEPVRLRKIGEKVDGLLESSGLYREHVYQYEDDPTPELALAERWVEKRFDVNFHDWYDPANGTWGCDVYKMRPTEEEKGYHCAGLLTMPMQFSGFPEKDDAIEAAMIYVLEMPTLSDVQRAADNVVLSNRQQVGAYEDGNKGMLGFFVGELCKRMPGADPKEAISAVRESLRKYPYDESMFKE